MIRTIARVVATLATGAVLALGTTDTASAMSFREDAPLDTSNVVDMRNHASAIPIVSASLTGTASAPVITCRTVADGAIECADESAPANAQPCVIIPNEYNPETTPTVRFGDCWVPDESPEGGYPVAWLDNSIGYSDGWMVWVNDSIGDVTWHYTGKDYTLSA